MKLVFKVTDKLASDAPLMGHDMEFETLKVRIGFRFEIVVTLIVETLRTVGVKPTPVRAFEIWRSPMTFRVQPPGTVPTPKLPAKDAVLISGVFAEVRAKTLGAWSAFDDQRFPPTWSAAPAAAGIVPTPRTEPGVKILGVPARYVA